MDKYRLTASVIKRQEWSRKKTKKYQIWKQFAQWTQSYYLYEQEQQQSLDMFYDEYLINEEDSFDEDDEESRDEASQSSLSRSKDRLRNSSNLGDLTGSRQSPLTKQPAKKIKLQIQEESSQGNPSVQLISPMKVKESLVSVESGAESVLDSQMYDEEFSSKSPLVSKFGNPPMHRQKSFSEQLISEAQPTQLGGSQINHSAQQIPLNSQQ